MAQTATNPIGATNNFGASNEVTATFTAAGGAPNVSDLFVFPGVGVAAAKALPSGVTYSGDYPTFAEFIEAMTQLRLRIDYIRMQTNNTGNYSGKLVVGERKPNLQNTRTQDINLSQYRESTGNGYSDVLLIPTTGLDGGLATWEAFFLQMKGLLQSSSVTFFFGVTHINKPNGLYPALSPIQ